MYQKGAKSGELISMERSSIKINAAEIRKKTRLAEYGFIPKWPWELRRTRWQRNSSIVCICVLLIHKTILIKYSTAY